MHAQPAGVQRRTDELERIDVQSPLSPMVVRQLARRRADRPQHLTQDAADEPDSVMPRGPGAVAIAGILFLVLALGIVVVALWPRGPGGGDGLVATGVTTTEPPFTDPTEAAAARRAERPSTTEAESEPGTTDTTEPTSTTAEPSTTTAGPGDDEAGTTSSTSGETTSTTDGEEAPAPSTPPSSGGSPTTSRPPAPAAPPSTAPSTTAPSWGDPNQDATWDRLAQCETGGNWSYNAGDGRYGGLRMRDEDFQEYGGRGYPHQHSRETQIAIARRLQADEGWDYWRSCARQLGYT